MQKLMEKKVEVRRHSSERSCRYDCTGMARRSQGEMDHKSPTTTWRRMEGSLSGLSHTLFPTSVHSRPAPWNFHCLLGLEKVTFFMEGQVSAHGMGGLTKSAYSNPAGVSLIPASSDVCSKSTYATVWEVRPCAPTTKESTARLMGTALHVCILESFASPTRPQGHQVPLG